MAKGSQKGSGFEREQCREWSLWFSSQESADIFWRTEGSGGRAKSRAKKISKENPEAAKRLLKYSYGDMSFQLPEGEPLIATILFEFKRGYSAGRNLNVKELQSIVSNIAHVQRGSKKKMPEKSAETFVRKLRKIFTQTRKASGAVDILDFCDGGEKKNPPNILKWWQNAEEECREAKRKQVILVLKRDGRSPVVFLEESFARRLFRLNKICHGLFSCGSYNLVYLKQIDFFGNITPEALLAIAKRSRKIKRRSRLFREGVNGQ